MPAPAVYVIAILGTVGAALAFKQFIYEPHIAPRIVQWKVEFQAARKRRAESERTAVMAEVALIQRGASKNGRQNSEDDDDDDDSDHPDVAQTLTLRAPVQPYMKNGLLIRRRPGTAPSKPGDVELDEWITGTSTVTETSSQQSDLRLRENHGSWNQLIQPILHTPLSPTSPCRTPTNIQTGGVGSSRSKTCQKPIELELKETAEADTFLDQSIQAIPYTPLSPIRTPTSHALPTPSPSPCPDDTASAPSIAESSPRSPPDLSRTYNVAIASVAQLQPANVDNTTTLNSSTIPLSPLVPLSSPPAHTLSSPQPHLLFLTESRASPYQTPHIHTIPSLSQSYPLDELLDYEHGLELLSPPSPLSRTDSPFEFAELSPRPEMREGSTLLLARSGNQRMTGEQLSAAPVNSISDSTRSSAYFSFHSSPALSTSSISASERGYENDSSRSEFSSTFSSPIVAPTRLGLGLDLESESLRHDQAHLSRLLSPLPSRSSPSLDPQRHRRQQEEGNIGSVSPTPTRRFDDYDETQTLSPRNRTRSPWMMMNRTATESVATTSISTRIQPMESATRMSRVITSDSDFDTASELSDLEFLSGSAEEYKASVSGPAAAVGHGSRSGMYAGEGGGSVVGRVGGIGSPGIGGGNESDASNWSLAGGSE